MRILTLALLMLAALTGCWAIQDVVTNSEMDRSLPKDAEVRSGSIIARTPDRYLLEEPTKTGLSLRSASMGIPTSRYTARMEQPALFNAALEKNRKAATYTNTYQVVLQGQEREVTLLLHERKSSVDLVYTALLAGGAADGIAVTYSTGYFHSAFGGERWWDKPPQEFLRFAESVSIDAAPDSSSKASR